MTCEHELKGGSLDSSVPPLQGEVWMALVKHWMKEVAVPHCKEEVKGIMACAALCPNHENKGLVMWAWS